MAGQPSGTTSADRVADVLALLVAQERPMRVTEIAQTLGVSKAVVHRILQSLVSRSLVRQVPDQAMYALGPVLTGLAASAWSPGELRRLSAPVLGALRELTGETTTLSVLVGRERVYVGQHESPHEVKMVIELGKRVPLHSGASSKAILAFLPADYIEEGIEQLRSATSDVDPVAYRASLTEIRERGYAISENERHTGAASIAAPVFGPARLVLGSISVSGPMFRFASGIREQQVRHVVTASAAITEALANSPRP